MRRDSIGAKATERPSAIVEYSPAEKRGFGSIKTAVRRKRGEVKSYSPIVGAKVTPQYVERTPQMWAVEEVHITAISQAGLVANFAFAFASFCVGFALNIIVGSLMADKLTDAAKDLLYYGTPILVVFAVGCFVLGGIMISKREGIWEQIKKDSKPRLQP